MKTILYVCVHNVGHSQRTETFTNDRARDANDGACRRSLLADMGDAA